MFDHIHLGWLASDDYRVASEAAGVVELPAGPEPDIRATMPSHADADADDAADVGGMPGEPPAGRGTASQPQGAGR